MKYNKAPVSKSKHPWRQYKQMAKKAFGDGKVLAQLEKRVAALEAILSGYMTISCNSGKRVKNVTWAYGNQLGNSGKRKKQ